MYVIETVHKKNKGVLSSILYVIETVHKKNKGVLSSILYVIETVHKKNKGVVSSITYVTLQFGRMAFSKILWCAAGFFELQEFMNLTEMFLHMCMNAMNVSMNV